MGVGDVYWARERELAEHGMSSERNAKAPLPLSRSKHSKHKAKQRPRAPRTVAGAPTSNATLAGSTVPANRDRLTAAGRTPPARMPSPTPPPSFRSRPNRPARGSTSPPTVDAPRYSRDVGPSQAARRARLAKERHLHAHPGLWRERVESHTLLAPTPPLHLPPTSPRLVAVVCHLPLSPHLQPSSMLSGHAIAAASPLSSRRHRWGRRQLAALPRRSTP